MPRSIPVTVTARTTAGAEHAFDTIAPIDLSVIFERWFVLPGVRGVRDQSGPWDAPGRTRTVILEDGGEAPERLTAYDRPRSFAYRVGPFPRPLGLLASHAEGDWTFRPDGTSTAIAWTYRFAPAAGRGLLVRALIAPLWRRYAQAALDRAIAIAER